MLFIVTLAPYCDPLKAAKHEATEHINSLSVTLSLNLSSSVLVQHHGVTFIVVAQSVYYYLINISSS